MDHLQRDLTIVMRGLVSSSYIEEFNFETGKKHPKINFKHGGRWHSMPYSMSPRTSNSKIFVAQKVKRIIRNGTIDRVQ